MSYHFSKLAFLLAAIILFSCNSKNNSNEVANYVYDEKTAELNPEMVKKIGNWINEDVICYGLIVSIDEEGNAVRGKPVKAKVVKMAGNEIKMKALESINIAKNQDCKALGIKKGTTWVETDGELFKTKEEADHYLEMKNLQMD
jgi:hypothetical protein